VTRAKEWDRSLTASQSKFCGVVLLQLSVFELSRLKEEKRFFCMKKQKKPPKSQLGLFVERLMHRYAIVCRRTCNNFQSKAK
jgi:hypothetical protein